MSIAEYKKIIKTMMSENRYNHCVNVSKEAVKLAKRYGGDEEKAAVAGILHDIGMFIRMEEHQFHSQYIIVNSEIFGIRKYDNKLVGLIARFHRGSGLPQDDEQFMMLPRADRMMVLKLTAILRIADALDRAHQQKLKGITISKQNDTILLNTNSNHNIVLERKALAEKANIFEYVFGYKIILA